MGFFFFLLLYLIFMYIFKLWNLYIRFLFDICNNTVRKLLINKYSVFDINVFDYHYFVRIK